MQPNEYDVIVCGLGINGAVALNYLSENPELRVLGIEAHTPGHEFSGSWGESRLLRRSYEDVRYIPLVNKSHELWSQIDAESNDRLLKETDLLLIAKEDNKVLHDLKLLPSVKMRTLTHHEIQKKFPFLRVPEDYRAYLESNALILFPEKIIDHCIQTAQKNNAHIVCNSRVQNIESCSRGIKITTPNNIYFGKRVLLTVGGWISNLFPNWNLDIKIYESPFFWFSENHSEPPITTPFLIFNDAESLYGFPSLGQGVKIASYDSGREILTPDARNQESTFGLNEIQRSLEKFLPGVQKIPRAHHTCFFDMGSNEDLILGASPTDSRLVFIAGGSGHGFKMAPILAKTAIDLLFNKKRAHEMEFLNRLR